MKRKHRVAISSQFGLCLTTRHPQSSHKLAKPRGFTETTAAAVVPYSPVNNVGPLHTIWDYSQTYPRCDVLDGAMYLEEGYHRTCEGLSTEKHGDGLPPATMNNNRSTLLGHSCSSSSKLMHTFRLPMLCGTGHTIAQTTRPWQVGRRRI